MSYMYNSTVSQPVSSTPSSASTAVKNGSNGRVTAPALRRGLDILELFLESNDGLKVPEMTERLGIPRASVHELVGALVERGYLQAKPDVPGRFVLCVRALQLGGAYERELDLAEVGRETARRIAAKCGETVQIVVREGKHVVYLVKVDSTHSIRLVSEVGRRLPAHCTAVGKALLAALPDDEVDALFPDDASLMPMTSNSISTKERLFRELALTRERGFAEENGESNENAACVAAPVYDRSGNCISAISISVPSSRMDETKKSEYINLVLQGARELSTSLGSPLH